MKRAILIVGLSMVSLILVLACGKQEEDPKAQKLAAAEKATAAKVTPAQPILAKPKPEKKELLKEELKKSEPAKSAEEHGQKPDLNQVLLTYLAKTGDNPKNANPHRSAQIDLNGDGQQDALVLLENPYWCGTGGCTMLVFKGTQSGFAFISRSSLIRGPVLVSETRTHGWLDLIVEVSGGGIAPKQVALKYNGSKYPLNPSTLPPLPKNQPLAGTKVF